MRWVYAAIVMASIGLAGRAQEAASSANAAVPATAANAANSEARSLTIPAGTKVPLVLKHAITTKTVRVGDNVYAATNFPVVVNNRMAIPSGTYVQGTISQFRRPGRIKGRAELLVHFNTLIFPNGYTLMLPGAVENVPGAENSTVKNPEGTIQANGSKGKDAGTIAGTAATGTLIGAAAGGGKGAALGAASGGAAGALITLLTRANEVRLEPGTTLEMVIERPLTLDESRLPVVK